MSPEIEKLAKVAVDCGFHIHKGLGPGLLESAYEALLCDALMKRGLHVERQKIIPIRLGEVVLEEGFRADILLENKLLIELKSVERLSAVHGKQLLTYHHYRLFHYHEL